MADNSMMINIPVFSVVKHGVTLKNIFLNNPQCQSLNPQQQQQQQQQQQDDPILIGRHPDCHIVLDHPSISRFHLEVRANPASQTLSIVDLFSVHGTWVSGTKIQPKIPVDLTEGDVVKLGASTRVYKLQWVVPLNGAYEMEKKRLPSLLEEEIEETHHHHHHHHHQMVNPPDEDLSGISEFSPVLVVSESVVGSSSLAIKGGGGEKRTPEKNVDEKECTEKKGSSLSLLSRRSKSKSVGFLSVETGRSRSRAKIEKETEEVCRVLFGAEREQEDKENMTPLSSVGRKSHLRSAVKRLNDEFDERQDAFVSTPLSSRMNKGSSSSSVKCLTAEFEEREEDVAFCSDNENWTPVVVPSELLKAKKSIQISEEEEEEEEEEAAAFYSDKENVTPMASGVKKSKKRVQSESHARMERVIMERRSERVPLQSLLNSPLKNATSPLISHYSQKAVDFASPIHSAQRVVDKGNNKYSTFSHDHHQVQGDELLSSNSSSSHSVCLVLNNKAHGEKRKWYMVVDIGCFLNAESRKSLQLLQGLKGTQLVIPRIVIRELDCLKRRESVFRKEEAKVASSALQWIEECMVKSSWWIHVQSSAETVPAVATPPRSQFGDGSCYELGNGGVSSSKFMPFSTCGTLMDIVSPTADDHILDCALLFAGIKDDGQLVLLTNGTTLKIKAMAEGLLCETPNEFRESLVNPCSKRFLWADSSPRGYTWSCFDEAEMIESYYCSNQFQAGRKTAKVPESVKGLKLILLHNSHYGKTSSVN